MFAGQVVVAVCYLAFMRMALALPENTKTSLLVRSGAERRDKKHQVIFTNPPVQDAPPGNAYLESRGRTSFNAVVFVAAANLVINTIRPDPNISWQMKVPRILWEITIMVLAKVATSTALPAIYILLACVLGSTAMVDLFVWAPLFASFAHFESCEGGFFRPQVCRSDFTKGLGRMLVVVQCIATGLFYLMSAITAMGSFTSIRDEQKVERQLRTMHRWEEQHRQYSEQLTVVG